MTDHTIVVGRKTPIWFWIVAVLALLWNSVGVIDYVMTQTKNEGYLAGFSPEQLAYFDAFPSWYVAVWALAVFTAFFGSIALLARARFAAQLFSASIVLFVINVIYGYGFLDGYSMMGAFGAVFSFVIFLTLAGAILFARWARKAELLR